MGIESGNTSNDASRIASLGDFDGAGKNATANGADGGNAIDLGGSAIDGKIKKARGRPPKLDSDGNRISGARDYAAERARRAGSSGEAVKPKPGRVAVGKALAPTLQVMHAMVADLTGLSFLSLEKTEAEQLSDAAQDIFSQYDMAVPPEVAAWLKLIGVCGIIYGPRVMLYKQFQSARRAAMASAQEQTLQ